MHHAILDKELLVRARLGWGQPPTGWPQPHLPGWAPLMDPGPFPLHPARSVGRWLWPTLAVSGFLAVVVQVLDHDSSAPGLSYRGLLTVALAAVVVVLLTIHRRNGPRPLTRAVAEYAAVALLATLLTTPGVGIDQEPADHPDCGQARAQASAGAEQPAVVRAVTSGRPGSGLGRRRPVDSGQVSRWMGTWAQILPSGYLGGLWLWVAPGEIIPLG